MTAATTAAAQAVIAAAIAHTAAVDGYRAYTLNLVAVREARADVAAAHRALVATPGDVDADAYLAALARAATTAVVTRSLIAAHLAGTPDR